MNRGAVPRVIIGLTSHGDLAGRRATGYYVPEVADSWRVFADAGYEIDFVSVRGGEPPAEGGDDSDPVQREFAYDEATSAKLKDTLTFSQVQSDEYDAVLFAGGHGVMWDFPTSDALARVAREIYEAGGVVAAVCHGPAAFVGVVLSSGRPLIEGKNFAAFTNSEERAAGTADIVPFLLQSILEELGGMHAAAEDYAAHVVTDGRLITGQNPASAVGVAQAVVAALHSDIDES